MNAKALSVKPSGPSFTVPGVDASPHMATLWEIAQRQVNQIHQIYAGVIFYTNVNRRKLCFSLGSGVLFLYMVYFLRSDSVL